ncbi:hypothetical protein ONZ45_g3777 [Pleurotus djamor]|nr:hypothetical protein ONZ45_g3777 [Pleurotus djamor]
MNALKFPWFAKYDIPEQYGLAPGKTLNLHLQTSDNITIGAWFILSDSYYQQIHQPPSREELLSTHIPQSLSTRPTILFLHGNAATRAFSARVAYYKAFSSRLGANVLAIDYRGFGDSEGSPSEDGLARDARAGWDWIIDMKKRTPGATTNPGDDVLIVGHSLGTAVSARLASELSTEGIKYRGVALLSPFASIETLLHEYNFFGLVPLLKPIRMIPGADKIIKWGLVHRFDTAAILATIKEPILIAHARK